MPKITTSLAVAHRLMRRLREENAEPKHRPFDVLRRRNVNIAAGQTVEIPAHAGRSAAEIVERIRATAEDARERYERRHALDLDYRAVKESVFTANQESGVSERLAETDALKREEKWVRSLLDRLADWGFDGMYFGDIDDTMVERLQEDARSREEAAANELTVVYFERERLEERQREIRQRLHALDEEIRSLNTDTEVTFEISEVGAEILGL